MKKHEIIYKTYKRNHKGNDFEDAEKTKIKREKSNALKLERKADRLMENLAADTENDGLRDMYQELLHAKKKTAGNRKNHQNRLNELQKNSDF